LIDMAIEMSPRNSILEELFLREKPARILLGMKTSRDAPVYATLLSKEADCTYSHTIKILNAFRKLGIVRFEKKGRIKTVALTDDGWDIAHNLEAMIKKFSQIETSEREEEPPRNQKGKKNTKK
jgi:predicted transcriptional regulator